MYFLQHPSYLVTNQEGLLRDCFRACSKGSTRPTFPGLTLVQWRFLFNSRKEYLIEEPYPILIQEDTLAAPNSTVITYKPMGNISPLSPILEDTFALSTLSVVASETTIEELSTVLELEAGTEPPPC